MGKRLGGGNCFRAGLLLGVCAATATATTAATNEGATEPRLTITSDSGCPSESAVLAALAALVPPAEWPDGRVRIQAAADLLVVDLVSDGATQRQVQVPPDCGLRATTVALVIATWTGRLASDAAGAPVLRGQAVKTAPTTISAPPVVAGAERELAAGILLSASGGIAPGLRIDFVETRAPRGFGWQVGLALPARRERGTAPGSTSWTRAAASIAVNGRITLGRLFVSADLGLAGAYTFTSAEGYSVDQGWEAITGGLVGGVRFVLPWRRFGIWTDGRATKWLFPQSVAFDESAGGRVATVALPSYDLQWAVGLSYRFR
jgi:hypothetical protein